MVRVPKRILPLIVIAQFCCTSLWFAGNAIMSDLALNFNLNSQALGQLTSSIQFGFISGTFLFALLTITDRFSPSRVFFISALLGAGFNLGVLHSENTLWSLLGFRFLTGFFLAGIYPVGMKIAADYFEKGLGKSLSFLVGALVLGTAFPHLLKSNITTISWETVILITSGLATLGGIFIITLVPDGPYQKLAPKFDSTKILQVFKNSKFRAAAFGYFGHMWELYTFWAFVPFLLKTYTELHSGIALNIPMLSFSVIAIGTIGCILGGYISMQIGVKKTAIFALSISGICCLLSPILLLKGSTGLFILFLIVWGMAVIADSPLFSTLVAQNVETESKGTALTIVNSIGFAITIVSILLFSYLIEHYNAHYLFTVLAIGPLFGLISLGKKINL
ncbi:MFS transporter [Winogradskyella sp. E313]|uniref:MFS transporter n=1 Tax=Winogradskyella immobilis TaxID=2816852 RepID=A0ABS8EMT1_9FLAO|nr:MFS transporter [Winogradskyella immobilis]